MKEIKYTNDNKKVNVIAKVNNSDYIVREVFIVDGKEIASGENFVVSSVHDAPVVSWKEKHLKEMEERYESERKTIDRNLDTLRKSYNIQKDRLSGLSSYLRKVTDENVFKAFELVSDVLTGKIEWVVKEQYSSYEVIKFEDLKITYDGTLKLMSLFGDDTGDFSLRLNQYRDGSGSGWETVHLFKDKKSAMAKFTELLNGEKQLSDTTYETAKKYGIKISKEKLKAYKDYKINNIKTSMERAKQGIEADKKKIKEIEAIK